MVMWRCCELRAYIVVVFLLVAANLGSTNADVVRSQRIQRRRSPPSLHLRRPFAASDSVLSAAHSFYRRNSNSLGGVRPGGLCVSDRDCAGYPSALCDRVCRCVPGALHAGTTCVPAPKQLNAPTLPSCPGGHVYVHEAGACLSTAHPGEPCQYSQQCSGTEAGAFCLKLRCECVVGMKIYSGGCVFSDRNCTIRGHTWIPELGECKQVIPPGGTGCSHSSQCTAAFNGTVCYRQTCTCPFELIPVDGTCGLQCPSGESFSAVTGECLPMVRPGEQCVYSTQCHAAYPSLLCDRGRCRCPNGQVFVGSACANSCPRGYIVGKDAVCKPGCRGTQVEHEGECYEQVLPGQSCLLNAQCLGGSTCVEGLCKCPPSSPEVAGVCRPKEVGPMESCALGEACGGGSFCSAGNCTCPLGTEAINGRCATPITVGPGENCMRLNAKCEVGTLCVGGVCACNPGTILRDGHCKSHVSANPGEPCGRGEECTNGAFCDEYSWTCQCPSEKIKIGKQCHNRLQSPPGFPCGNGEMCIGGSFCESAVCVCHPNEVRVDRQCSPTITVNPGDDCSGGQICGGRSECNFSTKRCTCPSNQRVVNKMCTDLVTVRAGESCAAENSRCSEYSYCVRGRCECAPGMTLVNGNCLLVHTAQPGESCANGERCAGDSRCWGNRCECMPPRSLYSARCELPSRVSIGLDCRPFDVCAGGSECVEGVCLCADHLVIRRGECSQRLAVRPGFLCGPDDRCIGGSSCVDGKCVCNSGFVIRFDRCVNRDVFPGDACTSAEVCSGGSVCVEGYCVCTGDHIIYNRECREQPLSQPGMACGRGEKCVGGSSCDYEKKLCECPSGFVVRDSVCERPPSDAQVAGFRTIDTEPPLRGSVEGTWERERAPVARVSIPQSSSIVRATTAPVSTERTTDGMSRQLPAVLVASTAPYSTLTSYSLVSETSSQPPRQSLSPGTSSAGLRTSVGYTRNAFVFPASEENNTPLPTRTTSAEISSRCVASNQCPSGADCVHGVCRCLPGTVASKFGFCVPVFNVRVGNACGDRVVCGGGSTCVDGVCTCPLERNRVVDGECVTPIEGYANIENTRARSRGHIADTLSSCPDPGVCRLPDCYCSRTGLTPPNNLDHRAVPQMVILTFDDPITDRLIKIYKSIFSGKFRNPNGCPIKGTFFVSHEWNNYDQTQWLVSQGHEIGVNSISHDGLKGESVVRWRHEMVGMRDALRQFSYMLPEDVVGIRAPYLELGGDDQFEMMASSGFVYDNSMAASGGPFWPQTLDYAVAWNCSSQGCPRRPHPGIWAFPINKVLVNGSNEQFSMLADAVRSGESPSAVAEMLLANFWRSYRGNRAPFVLTADADFLEALPQSGAVAALEMFVRKVLNNSDVYIVTAFQALQWMQRPTRLLKIHNFTPWKCPLQPNRHVFPCENPSSCTFTCDRGERHTFRVCGSCPRAYPKLGDPTGTGNLTTVR